MASHPTVQAQIADSQTHLQWIADRTDTKQETYTAISDEVWELAELRFQEVKSVAAQKAVMIGGCGSWRGVG